ncbi:short-chain dehydrogenase/reductase SDR [Thermobaculum terrenum ATCC BAA-798]|uniref:Short-chain dehydrogenase/reductase SDR n=1 Tax=Thermobaculum terrenum (strain ATCC BAA-798 / CCMEE 7001 / YNP1) TaxID=525904 RepID=D1CGN9_THET1|nr:glucose 1-dehydrogenase [Thermobaculum terrenum]ACZ42910.1 short-chain dehydrogenase/reductase SDR [Thermobaculum terrenum ATCC BAA-798]
MVTDKLRLDGKVALVTGGSQGLGRAMAVALAEAGADVALCARSRERLCAVADEIRALGRGALVLPADLSDVDAAVGVVDDVVRRLGRLDVLVTSAATQLRKPALEVTLEEWDRLVAVNLRSVYFMCQRAAQHMIAREDVPAGASRGKIINIASLTSVGAWPDVSVYATTKGGILQMTRAFALEWARYHICVNAIGPGTFHTELTDALYSDPERAQRIVSRIPLGRAGLPEDLAGAVVYLASPASDYVTGQVLWVDGGFMLMGAGL